jgi:predicted methyltransferase
MFKIVLKATQMAQEMVKKVVKHDDTVVDATLGNGNDTIFLHSLVPHGRVVSFDIQEEAIRRFEGHILEMDIKNIELICSGHENMDLYVSNRPSAIMFNLGYLPGGNENIITLPQTTVTAVKKGTKLLCPGGIITILSYSGHPGGMEEQENTLALIRGLNPRIFSVMEIKFSNGKQNAPLLIVVEKNDKYHEDK